MGVFIFGGVGMETRNEILFHAMGCVDKFEDLREGMKVEFSTITNPDGRQRAIGVVLA
jgi:cold shock CspA family protein